MYLKNSYKEKDPCLVYFVWTILNLCTATRLHFLNILTPICVVFKARLIVRDGGTPRLSDTATVVITVPRNNFSPGFLHGNLQVRIPFNEDIGTVVADVNATDADGAVSTPFCCSSSLSSSFLHLSQGFTFLISLVFFFLFSMISSSSLVVFFFFFFL